MYEMVRSSRFSGDRAHSKRESQPTSQTLTAEANFRQSPCMAGSCDYTAHAGLS
jgi:hypothetical protein